MVTEIGDEYLLNDKQHTHPSNSGGKVAAVISWDTKEEAKKNIYQ